jgi:hypothetical protein
MYIQRRPHLTEKRAVYGDGPAFLQMTAAHRPERLGRKVTGRRAFRVCAATPATNRPVWVRSRAGTSLPQRRPDVVGPATLGRLYGIDLLDFLRTAGFGPRR